MTRRNKFGIMPDIDSEPVERRDRRPGPMGTAIRDTAESLQAATDEKVEQRRRNASDAKDYREALVEGRILVSIPLTEISTDDLPRDRLELEAVATSDEMEELKASIRARGQREPVEVYRDGSGAFQLKSGWRRLNALRQLHDETGDVAYEVVKARVAESGEDRLTMYIDMAEENIIREDLTFAEMAQLAITASKDAAFEQDDAGKMVGDLYRSVHKVKRSYIRSFVLLIEALGETLQWPKDVARNVGVEAARIIKADPDAGEALRKSMGEARNAADQTKRLQDFIAGAGKPKAKPEKRKPKEKYEFHLDDLKITARHGECRIVGPLDYTTVPRDRLEQAIAAFKRELDR